MPHRSQKQTLRDERDRILERLSALEVQAGPEIDVERAELLGRLDGVRRSLEQITPPRSLPILASLRLVRGCDVPWDAMVGDARVRHCGVCDREVYDLTAMDPDEIEAFLAARKEALPCMRLHRRRDGRVQAGVCGKPWPLGRAIVVAGALGLAALAAWMQVADEEHACRRPAPVADPGEAPVIMGEYQRIPVEAPPPEREPFGWNNVPRPLPAAPVS